MVIQLSLPLFRQRFFYEKDLSRVRPFKFKEGRGLWKPPFYLSAGRGEFVKDEGRPRQHLFFLNTLDPAAVESGEIPDPHRDAAGTLLVNEDRIAISLHQLPITLSKTRIKFSPRKPSASFSSYLSRMALINLSPASAWSLNKSVSPASV